MTDLLFCPKCRKPAIRVEAVAPLPPAWMADMDEFFATGDSELEDDLERLAAPLVRVLIAPAWRTALMINPNNTSNLSFGCPLGCKGKLLLFNKTKEKEGDR